MIWNMQSDPKYKLEVNARWSFSLELGLSSKFHCELENNLNLNQRQCRLDPLCNSHVSSLLLIIRNEK